MSRGRVICVDLKGNLPIACAVPSNDKNTREHINTYQKNGKVDDHSEMMQDIFLPPKKEYVNLYRFKSSANYGTKLFDSEEEAREEGVIHDCGWDYIKTIEVEV